MTCRAANRFVLHGWAQAAGATTQGRAFMFRGWVCGQRQTGGRYSPTLNVCADGTRSVRFLFAG